MDFQLLFGSPETVTKLFLGLLASNPDWQIESLASSCDHTGKDRLAMAVRLRVGAHPRIGAVSIIAGTPEAVQKSIAETLAGNTGWTIRQLAVAIPPPQPAEGKKTSPPRARICALLIRPNP